MNRIGMVIRLKPGAYAEYKRLHDAAWPEVLDLIRKANIRNYTIYHWNGLLFSHFEYVGEDLAADIAAITAEPMMREWWQLTDPLQEPVQGNSTGSIEGNWWTAMEEVFHTG